MALDKLELQRIINLIKNKNFKEALEKANALSKNNEKDEVLANIISIIFRRLGNYEKAEYWANKAIALKDDFWGAINNKANIFHERGDVGSSLELFKSLIDRNPSYIEARANYALALKSSGNYLGALTEYQKIQEIKVYDLGIFHIAITLLCLGFFEEGWEKHEYRWKVDPLNNVKWPIEGKPLWDGERDSDIVLWREQGIGDELIFLGLVPEARDLSKSVSVYIDKRLIPLCERSMPDVRFLADPEQIGEQEFDYHLPMGSLPRLFRSAEEEFKKTVKGYLKADADRVEVLRQELNVGDRKIIGISWKSIKSLNHLKKSLTLMEFGKIFQDLDVVLLNLQYGEVDEEIKAFEKDTGIEIIQCLSVDNREDLDGLAALIELCDLVVSTSNVTIHLAGALGKDTWVLLPYVANFWWLLERTDSVWYPSLTLYRQKTLKDWDSVALELKEDLKKKFNT